MYILDFCFFTGPSWKQPLGDWRPPLKILIYYYYIIITKYYRVVWRLVLGFCYVAKYCINTCLVSLTLLRTLFSRTVRENLRVVLTVSSLGPRFQKRCRDFPSLMNTVSIILLPHWSKEALVTHAYHLLKGNFWNLFILISLKELFCFVTE